MHRSIRLTALLSAFILTAAGDVAPVSDAALTAIAKSRFNPDKARTYPHLLGINRGVMVVADYPCSDICPAETVRIIHYAIAPGPRCAAVGGVIVNRGVPAGIAVAIQPFCVPKAVSIVEDAPRRSRKR
jgi:hypothetical protein